MTLIGFFVPPTSLAWFLTITFNLAMSTRRTSTESCHSAAYRVAALGIGGTSSAGRSGHSRVLKPFEGVEHDGLHGITQRLSSSVT
jgi:hypothetical protein